jgi:hypothetical protein
MIILQVSSMGRDAMPASQTRSIRVAKIGRADKAKYRAAQKKMPGRSADDQRPFSNC